MSFSRPAVRLAVALAALFPAFLAPAAHAAGAFVQGTWDASAVPEAAILSLQWGPREARPGAPDRLLGQVASDTLRTVEILLREPARSGGDAPAPVLSVSAPASFLGLSRTAACACCTNQWSQPDTSLASRTYQPGRGCLFDVSFRPAGKASQLEVADVRYEGKSVPYLLPFEGAPRVRRLPGRLAPNPNASLHAARVRVEGGVPPAAAFDPAAKAFFDVGGDLGITMMRIPAGVCRRDGRMDLVITNDFYLARTELTQGQWRAIVGTKPPHPQLPESADCPVQGVTADDARLVCLAMDVLHPVRGYRWTVPTQTQFEYAARAGETGARPAADLDSLAWHAGNSAVRVGGSASPKKSSHPVAGKAPNGFGLYDTIGNVSELCRGDGKREEYASAGSGYWTKPEDCHFPRAEAASYFGGGAQHVGVRLALSPPVPEAPPKAPAAKKPRWNARPAVPPPGPVAPETAPASDSVTPAAAEEGWTEEPDAHGPLEGISTHLTLDPPRKVKIFHDEGAVSASKFPRLRDLVFLGGAGRTRGRIGFVTEQGRRETGFVDMEEIGLFDAGHGLVADARGGPWGSYITLSETPLWRMGPDGRAHTVATVPKGTVLRLYGYANDAGTVIRAMLPPHEGHPAATALLRMQDLR